MADDLHALAAHLGADRIDLLGFSFGASVAMEYAARYPETLRSVIIASGCAYPDDVEPYFRDDPDYRARRALARDTDPGDYAGAPDGALSRAMAHDSLPLNVWDEARWDDWRRALDGVRFSDDWSDAIHAGAVRRTGTDRPAALRRAGIPVLIVHGEREMSFPVALARRLHEDVPSSRLVLVPDAAHMARFDNPTAWTAAIRHFLTAARP